jgi:hypothetical protein
MLRTSHKRAGRSKTAAYRAALAGAAIALAGCGAGDSADTSTSEATVPASPEVGKASPGSDASVRLTKAETRRLAAIALRDPYLQAIAGNDDAKVIKVAPWGSPEESNLIGGLVHVRLGGPVRLEDERLPATISPNHRAPSGTPILHRYARVSASNVTELEMLVELGKGRVVQIEPGGEAVKVTKIELIGPAPENPAYAPEPGY